MPSSNRIRAVREALGLSLDDLVERMHPYWPGLDKSALSKIERGKRNLSVQRLKHFATALGCDPKDLLDSFP